MDDPSHPPDIWGHHSLYNLTMETLFVGLRRKAGAVYQFGLQVPVENAGIGPQCCFEDFARLPLFPNRFITGDTQNEQIAGKPTQLYTRSSAIAEGPRDAQRDRVTRYACSVEILSTAA